MTDLGILVEAGLLQTGGRLLPTVLASSKGASQAEIEAGNPKHRLETEVLIGGFGKFTAAIERWQQVIGREAPAPTEPTGKDGSPRLSPKFTEWMMGVPAGWITDPEIWGEGYSDSQARNAQLKACGNGVVPQQAMLALRELLGVPRSERANA